MKEIQFVKKYIRYEKPSDEETEAVTRYIRTQAELYIHGRPAEDLDDLPAKFLTETLRSWRRKHPGLAKLDDATLWKKFTWILIEFLFEARAAWNRERKGPVCDAGMIADIDRSEAITLGPLQTLINPEDLETVEGRRTQFLDLLERHYPATEFVEREGSSVARLLLHVLRDVQRGQKNPEEALEVLAVVLETNELKFKERQGRVAWFLSILEEYATFDYQSYAEAGPVSQFPSCGLSESPVLHPALSPAQVEKLKSRYGLRQGQLAEVFGINETDVPAMKRRPSNAIQQAEESQAMETEAQAVLSARRAEIGDRLKIVLMTGLEK